ncbi:hypothetical protein SDRG_11394 [Saprolegnia diclina VS20]|uniref:Ricin B lectin domain-containing protein n=1 Tax=Saprolegnia diclina (strain VS20) TaxID=1156394 RepID=T0QBL3_SAPDV|nr:hypothetical protein SDRG_11394 [Saprolegnia diclina VS20]EQC30915.1 hypothetical protein SDRG_11394 [Saprolegnia diclina VS20]|eukprot:XP_008615653.1 hypothetical protein SDRG_11394 [Saprolegnia diclina VS20]
MKLLLGCLLAAATAATADPFGLVLCTTNRLVISEAKGALYTDVIRAGYNQRLIYDPTSKLLTVVSSGQCVKVASGSAPQALTEKCNPADEYQKWELRDNHVYSPAKAKCLETLQTMPYAPVNLADCDVPGSLAKGQFLADCNSIAPVYNTLTSRTGTKRLAGSNSSLVVNTVINNWNELFVWDQANKMFKSTNGQCLEVHEMYPRVVLGTFACDVRNAYQKWTYNPLTYKLEHDKYQNTCLDLDNDRVQMAPCSSSSPFNERQQWMLYTYHP